MINLLDPDNLKNGSLLLWEAQCRILLRHGREGGYDNSKNFYFRLQEKLANFGSKVVEVRTNIPPGYGSLVLTNWIAVMKRIENPDRDIICAFLLAEFIVEPKFEIK